MARTALVWLAVAGVAVSFSIAGCGSGETPGPTVKVMTWNVFIGGDVSRLLAPSTLGELSDAVDELFADVEASDFRDRATAIAASIAREQPDLVGLQEVALWRTQTPADGSQTPASDVAYDFLEILLDAIDEQGIEYAVAVSAEGVDGEVPTAARDVRFTDREVVLARSGPEARLALSNPRESRFATNFSVDTPLGELTVARGWASIDLTVEGRSARFVTTHLEVAPLVGVQLPQAEELVADARAADLPTILVGDINSRADGSGTETYEQLIESGFNDAWSLAHGDAPGFTCCRGGELAGEDSSLDERIDVTLLLGDFEVRSSLLVGSTSDERTVGGRWPSDHAGVVSTLRLP